MSVSYKMRRTIKIPVKLSEDTFLPLMKVCATMFNMHVQYAYKVGSYNKTKAHHALYERMKKLYPTMPTALIQSTRDTAMEAVKAVKLNPKRKPHKSDRSAVKFDKRCVTLRGKQLTISTLEKRHKLILKIPKYFAEVFENWDFTGLQLIYKFDQKRFYIALNYKKDIPPFQDGRVLGIDRGLKNIIYCSNGYAVSGKDRNRIKRKYAFNRKALQAKDTRSATRHLGYLSRREARFSLNENHIISKKLVGLDYQIYVLEKLHGIHKIYKGKRTNRRLSNWNYFQLELFLEYKASALGKRVAFVDARYTSQKCNLCNYVAKSNRKLEIFECQECGYTEHADLNAAKNIRDLYLQSESNITFSSSQSAMPIATLTRQGEPKARNSEISTKISIPSGQAAVNQPIVRRQSTTKSG